MRPSTFVDILAVLRTSHRLLLSGAKLPTESNNEEVARIGFEQIAANEAPMYSQNPSFR
jgi:hypothetical protein